MNGSNKFESYKSSLAFAAKSSQAKGSQVKGSQAIGSQAVGSQAKSGSQAKGSNATSLHISEAVTNNGGLLKNSMRFDYQFGKSPSFLPGGSSKNE